MVIIWILFSSNCQRLQCYDNVPYHRWTSVQISRASLNLFTCSRIPPLFKIPLLSEPWRYFRVAITDVTLHIFQQIYIYIYRDIDTRRLRNGNERNGHHFLFEWKILFPITLNCILVATSLYPKWLPSIFSRLGGFISSSISLSYPVLPSFMPF